MQIEAKSRVLIVDDEPDLREIIAFDFEAAGYDVDCAADGVAAWKALSAAKYDVVVSDIRMPKSDGVSLLKKVKTEGLAEKPIMVFITGYSDLLLEDAYHLGIDGFFTKPFDRRELVRAIARLLTPPLERWAQPSKSHQTFVLRMSFQSLEKAMAENDIVLGRGGIFLATPAPSFTAGSRVAFELDFGPCKIQGTGFIRWVRSKPSNNLKPGIGIEFEFLTEATLKIIKDLLKELYLQKKSQAFIPKG